MSQSTATANAEYHTRRIRIQTDLSSLFNKQAPVQSASAHSLSTRFDVYLTPRAFLFSLDTFERDDREFLNLRMSAGGGMGWQLVNSHVLQLSLLGGMTLVNESYRHGDEEHPERRESTGESLVGLSMDRFQLGRLRLTGKLSIFPSACSTPAGSVLSPPPVSACRLPGI